MAERIEVGDRVRIVVGIAFKGKEGTVEGVDSYVFVLLDGNIHSTAFLESECERIERAR